MLCVMTNLSASRPSARHLARLALAITGLAIGAGVPAAPHAAGHLPLQTAGAPPQAAAKVQPRPHSTRVPVDVRLLAVDDGDTVNVQWPANDVEIVRILGIDTPETRHPAHDLPYAQPFGEEAQAFFLGVLATATKVELLRAATLDPYGRTLGYVFVNDLNYSVLVVNARLAEESVTRYGDNGFPKEAADVLAAAKAAGPLPFESPGTFRARMRDVSKWLKARGQYPTP
jgi:endonuclease YncB( thermonuclease family)